MTDKLGTVFGHGIPSKPELTDRFSCFRYVGVEVELENVSEEQSDSMRGFEHWSTTTDGSLRNGIELISDVMLGADAEAAIDEVFSVITDRNVTWRTGLHVHVDVRDKTAKELHSICSLYAVLERAMFAVEGNNRHTSRFCVPWYTQPTQISMIAKACIDDEVGDLSDNANRMGKYSAVNLNPISRQGSIEFRQALMNADKEHVIKWILLCQSIVENASTLTSSDILMKISSDGPTDAIRSIIGDPFPEMYQLPNFSELVWDGVEVANLLEEQALTEKVNHSRTEGRCDYDSIVRRARNQ